MDGSERNPRLRKRVKVRERERERERGNDGGRRFCAHACSGGEKRASFAADSWLFRATLGRRPRYWRGPTSPPRRGTAALPAACWVHAQLPRGFSRLRGLRRLRARWGESLTLSGDFRIAVQTSRSLRHFSVVRRATGDRLSTIAMPCGRPTAAPSLSVPMSYYLLRSSQKSRE